MWKGDLLNQLTNGPVEKRVKAAEALAEFRDEGAVAALGKALRDKSYRVRLGAVESLARIGGPEAATTTVYALRDIYEEVRLRAIETLGALGCKEGVEPLIQLLEGDENPEIRLCVIDSMWSLADERCVPALQRCLADEDPLVRGHAAATLGRIGQSTLIPLLEAVAANETSPQAQVGLYGALAAMGRHESLGNLESLLASPDSRVRCAVASTLADIVRESNRRTLVRMLECALLEETSAVVRFSLECSLEELQSQPTTRVA